MRQRRSAFTLVEVLIGTAVLAVLCLGLWQVFGSASRSGVQSLWYAKAENQARSALALLRNDMAKATAPSRVTASDVDRSEWSNPEFHLRHPSGSDPIELASGGGEVELLRFHICEPEVATGDASVDKPGSRTLCVLRAFGTTLNYYRSGGSGATPDMNQDLVEDVKSIKIEVRPAEGTTTQIAGENVGQVVDLELTMVHPQPALFPNAKVVQQTTARAPVPAAPL